LTRLFAKCRAIVTCCAIVLAAAAALTASEAAASNWTLRQLPSLYLDENSNPVSASLSGVSCPTDFLCVAVGALNTLAFSQAPTGGAAGWHVVNPEFPVGPGKTCVEGEPHCPEPGGSLHAVSCASQSFCVVVSYEGFIYVSTDPTGGAGAWSPTVVNEKGKGATHLSGVSCPSLSLCVAVSGGVGASSGRVLTSTDPTSGSWQVTQLDGSLDFRGVSCGTPSLCVAVARRGRIFVSTNPTGGAGAWNEIGTPGGPGDLGGIGCIGTSLCAAGNAGGNILTSTNPAAGGGTWGEANAGGSVLVTGVSCPTVSHCVAVDNNGDVLTSADPTGDAGAWRFENLVAFRHEYGQSPLNALFGASCASTTLCALVGSNGRIFTATDPFAVPAAPGRRRGRKVPRRPRTILVLTDDFWFVTPTRKRHVRAKFRFYSPSKVRGFECKRGSRPYRRCRSPLRYWVGRGRHVLRVRAIGPTGLRGRPAIKHFQVRAPRAPR
jgi:hypothetical protein